jgi:hypothetical protein
MRSNPCCGVVLKVVLLSICGALVNGMIPLLFCRVLQDWLSRFGVIDNSDQYIVMPPGYIDQKPATIQGIGVEI